MQTVTVRCPNKKCLATLSIPANKQGYMVRCAICGQSFLVPPSWPVPKSARRKAAANSG